MKSIGLLFTLVFGTSQLGWAQDHCIFYDGFDTSDTSAWWAPARVGETGQVSCQDEFGFIIQCQATGQDGDIRGGVEWPRPRFTDNLDGTVKDRLTGLLWLRDADCFGLRQWEEALGLANSLASGACGLNDASEGGDWRLPSISELHSIVNYEFLEPALSDSEGTFQWSPGNPFLGVQVAGSYWSSTSYSLHPSSALVLLAGVGDSISEQKVSFLHLWPVRGGAHQPGTWDPAGVARTGQVTCFSEAGDTVGCAGTGQDGDIQPGVRWPSPRFVKSGDGSVVDMLTGLVWLENADCWNDPIDWKAAISRATSLGSGACGLTDGSVAGDWRLPSVMELRSLVDYQFLGPAVPNSAGTGIWSEGDPFYSVRPFPYWSSTRSALSSPGTGMAMFVDMGDGWVSENGDRLSMYVWPVRGVR